MNCQGWRNGCYESGFMCAWDGYIECDAFNRPAWSSVRCLSRYFIYTCKVETKLNWNLRLSTCRLWNTCDCLSWLHYTAVSMMYHYHPCIISFLFHNVTFHLVPHIINIMIMSWSAYCHISIMTQPSYLNHYIAISPLSYSHYHIIITFSVAIDRPGNKHIM